MKKTYRWGIMGAGIIARKMADALARTAGVELAFIGSRSDERAAAFARETGAPGYGSYERLLADESIDVVYVATTHNFHYDNARMALSSGKHVVMEKPFTVNAREAALLVALAAEKGLFLMEAIWTRFLPTHLRLREALGSGAIGDVRYIDISFGGFAPPKYEGRLKDPALAGGVTLDMGIYPVSFACHMLGERPSSIESQCRFSDRGVDELAAYQLRFPRGTIAHIGVSFALKLENRAAFYGSEGTILYSGFPSGDAYTVYYNGGTNEVAREETVTTEQAENGFVYQVEEVSRCLDAGLRQSPVIPLAETVEIMAAMDAMRAQWGLRYEFEAR